MSLKKLTIDVFYRTSEQKTIATDFADKLVTGITDDDVMGNYDHGIVRVILWTETTVDVLDNRIRKIYEGYLTEHKESAVDFNVCILVTESDELKEYHIHNTHEGQIKSWSMLVEQKNEFNEDDKDSNTMQSDSNADEVTNDVDNPEFQVTAITTEDVPLMQIYPDVSDAAIRYAKRNYPIEFNWSHPPFNHPKCFMLKVKSKDLKNVNDSILEFKSQVSQWMECYLKDYHHNHVVAQLPLGQRLYQNHPQQGVNPMSTSFYNHPPVNQQYGSDRPLYSNYPNNQLGQPQQPSQYPYGVIGDQPYPVTPLRPISTGAEHPSLLPQSFETAVAQYRKQMNRCTNNKWGIDTQSYDIYCKLVDLKEDPIYYLPLTGLYQPIYNHLVTIVGNGPGIRVEDAFIYSRTDVVYCMAGEVILEIRANEGRYWHLPKNGKEALPLPLDDIRVILKAIVKVITDK